MIRTKKTLSAGLRQELIDVMRPGIPVQDTASGDWSTPEDILHVHNFAQIVVSNSTERFGSKEYQPFDTIRVTLYSPVEIDTHDYVIIGSKRWNIAGVVPNGNGEVTLQCTPY